MSRETSSTPRRKPEKIFSLAWVLILGFVAALVGVSIFFGVMRLNENTNSFVKTCEARNVQVDQVNARFDQLIKMINAGEGSRPPLTPEVAALYAQFLRPIPSVSCDGLRR